MITLDASIEIDIGLAIQSARGAAMRYLSDYAGRRKSPHAFRLWDEVLAAVVMDPTVVLRSRRECHEVSNDPGDTRGALRPCKPGSGRPPITWVVGVDRTRVEELVHRSLDR